MKISLTSFPSYSFCTKLDNMNTFLFKSNSSSNFQKYLAFSSWQFSHSSFSFNFTFRSVFQPDACKNVRLLLSHHKNSSYSNRNIALAIARLWKGNHFCIFNFWRLQSQFHDFWVTQQICRLFWLICPTHLSLICLTQLSDSAICSSGSPPYFYTLPSS